MVPPTPAPASSSASPSALSPARRCAAQASPARPAPQEPRRPGNFSSSQSHINSDRPAHREENRVPKPPPAARVLADAACRPKRAVVPPLASLKEAAGSPPEGGLVDRRATAAAKLGAGDLTAGSRSRPSLVPTADTPRRRDTSWQCPPRAGPSATWRYGRRLVGPRRRVRRSLRRQKFSARSGTAPRCRLAQHDPRCVCAPVDLPRGRGAPRPGPPR